VNIYEAGVRAMTGQPIEESPERSQHGR